MNRKLFQQDSSSSLDLMLDVLSNVFGGVILISCLLAILPRHATPPPLSPVDLAKSEMIERRIDAAKSELEKIKEKIEKLSENEAPEMVALLQKRKKLNDTLLAIQEEIKHLNGKEDIAAEIEAILALGKSEEMAKRLQKLQQLLASEENLSKAIREKIDFLESRLKSLNKQLKDTNAGRQYAVRFPKEKGDEGNPLPIIVRYGRIYPLVIGENLKQNPSVRRTPVGEDATIMKPIPGRGWVLPRDTDKLKETLRTAKGEQLYVTVYLYPDSHSSFNNLKTLIFAAKIGYGLEFVPADRSLTFSSEGSKPPKL